MAEIPLYGGAYARFQPRNTATVRPELVPAIGRVMLVQFVWVEEYGRYAGQRVFIEVTAPDTPAAAMLSKGKWLPEEDLAFIEE